MKKILLFLIKFLIFEFIDSHQQLDAHEAEVQKLKTYFDDNMDEAEKLNYNFLLDSPKDIIETLYAEVQGKTWTYDTDASTHSFIMNYIEM